MAVLNLERLEQAKELVDNEIKIQQYLVGKGRISPFSRDNKFHCYINSDTRESMFINFNTNEYVCHSCGNKGKYISFVKHYEESIEGIKYSDSQVVEMALKKFPFLSEQLGFRTLYSSEVKDLLSIKLKPKIKFSTDLDKEIITWKTISRDYSNKSNDDILNMITEVLDGKSIEDIGSGKSVDKDMLDNIVLKYLSTKEEE